MNQLRFVNNFSAALTAQANAGATSITISSALAASLPALGSGDYFLMTITQAGPASSETSWEIVTVTAVNAGTGAITISALANTWPAGSKFDCRITAASLESFAALLNSRSVNPLGSVSGTQTIDLTGPGNISLTVGGALTLAFSNTPALNQSVERTFYITNGGAFAITYPANSQFFGPGVAGTSPTLATTGLEVLKVKAINIGGTVYYHWAYIGRLV